MFKSVLYLAIIACLIMATISFSSNVLLSNPAPKVLEGFSYGVAIEKEVTPININLVSGPWVEAGWADKNEKWLLQFRDPDRINQIPYINLYQTASIAKTTAYLDDCNVGADPSKTLCVAGANFVRQNKQQIFDSYKQTALQILQNYGVDKPIFLHFEPDFTQYGAYTQKDGGVAAVELADMMNSWTDIYKATLPNAKLVMDVSPWTTDLQEWLARFRNFDYVGVVGRRFPAQGNTIQGEKSYKQIVEMTGKKLIINDAHGPAGKWLEYNKDWENKDLVKLRYDEGVIAVIQPPTNIESLLKVSQVW
jgi:hypothetical protein